MGAKTDILEFVLPGPKYEGRRNHSRAVSERLVKLGQRFYPEVSRLYLKNLGLFHDIGYAPDILKQHHAVDGAKFLVSNAHESIADQVAWHSTTEWELALAGIDQPFKKPSEKVRALLWAADFTIGPNGEPIRLSERLTDIRNRHGADSIPVRALDKSFFPMTYLFIKYKLDSDPWVDLTEI